ncbi:DNA polymerase-like [Rutidosis leptorrhynchoides]|uniref:DNA polymerase-like n=1 Tax=Rutidosis leptorrhynchoides TaxID=125765 RepID=UPI003A99663C
MDLLNQFAYPSITTGYAKFGILITIRRSYGEEITFSIGPAIPLTDDSGCLLSKSVVYSNIYKLITKQAEIDDGDQLVRVTIRVYLDQDKKKKRPSLDEEDRYNLLNEIIEVGVVDTNDIIAMKIQHNKRRYLKNISPIDVKDQNLRPFIVSDLETLLDKNQFHKPYAAGLLMVFPGKEIQNWMIETWYSEDYSILYPEAFEKRSKKVLTDLVLRITALVKKNKEVQTIYFHNFSRFDGIILLKHLACNHKDFHLKPLMRNHRLYELAVYSGKKMLFRFRDSLNLLHGSLNDLAKSLCPDFGTKGSINYDEVTVDKLPAMKDEYIDYMKQDIYLLGGVMQKAQEIYSNLYKVDIESKITLSALSLSIFRMKYFDDSHFSIHIPNRNEDQFIRHGYYGGHTDAYKPHGKDLYFYDVNSLYPFIMKEFPMPHGAPVWYGNLQEKDLDNKLGFIEAYVECPKTLKNPFLPYRDKNGLLLFPTGKFVGVYFSEELKFAREIGYTVIPLSGYLFEKKESPFSNFVSNLFESRLEAKKSGNDALSYVYKILMNSLYGRFGINPQSTKTEVCDTVRSRKLLRRSELISADVLNDNCNVVSYHHNYKSNDYWDPPKNTAVQLSAAITAYARIYIYPYISREDCYYTDTDSVVLGNPLPDELISSSILGKFKLEDRISEGFFLALKSYCYKTVDGKEIVKFKGAAKDQISPEWFPSQLANPDLKQQVTVEAHFRIEWSTLEVYKKDQKFLVGINKGAKRKPVHIHEKWSDTEPIEVNDLSRLDHISKRLVMFLSENITHLVRENHSLHEKLSLMEKGIDPEMKEEPTEVTNPTVDEIPLTDNQPKKKPKTDKKEPKKKAKKKKAPLTDNQPKKKQPKKKPPKKKPP